MPASTNKQRVAQRRRQVAVAMPANAALYLPVDDVDLTSILPGAKLIRSMFKRDTAFDVPFKEGKVRFNVMPKQQVPTHRAQFLAYIDSLEDEEEVGKLAATRAVSDAITVLGLETQLEFQGNEELGDLLEQINDHYKGCIFMFDSVILHGGEVLVGPLKGSAT